MFTAASITTAPARAYIRWAADLQTHCQRPRTSSAAFPQGWCPILFPGTESGLCAHLRYVFSQESSEEGFAREARGLADT
jgi:hypothetical protein